MQVNADEEEAPEYPQWPYLSPARPGWTWLEEGGEMGNGPNSRILLREAILRWMQSNPTKCGCSTCKALSALKAAAQLRKALDLELRLLVTEAHSGGCSWGEIAENLECSKQAAHERYSRHVHSEETHSLLFDDLEYSLQRAQSISLSKEAGEEISEQAFVLLEQQEIIDRRLQD